MQALEVRRVTHSEDLLKPGDYVYVPKRPPIVTYERKLLEAPPGFFAKLWWHWFGQKYTIKQIVELQWPECDVAVLNCPDCNSPVATTGRHKIVSIEPLTIETPITCPYSKDFTFKVSEGKIMPA
jgi:hypothetical protein